MQHHHRPGHSGHEKRPYERVVGEGSHDADPEERQQKRPALASVIVEAVKMDSLQKLCSSLEPILRRVVGEEVERALAKLVPSRLGTRTPPRQLQEFSSSSLRLVFRNKLALPLFTGGKIEGERGLPIHIVLEDASSGQMVTTGPESSAKLEIVVLDGDFGKDEDEDGWTAEEFENHVVRERDGKRPLLTGDLFVTLKEGVGTLGELTFTDNSSWIRCRKFRLGVRVATGCCEGIRILECKTDAFTVKDHRGELYKKHYPPALNDEVWRLDKIGKDGAFHRRLNANHINTVEEFLRLYVMDQQKLRNILGSGMSNKMWEATVEHAKTCVLSGKLYVFYADSSHNIGVIFNNIYELMGITNNGQYKSVDTLSDNEKVYVDKLVKVAYENWGSVTEYDSEALVSENSYKSRVTYSQDESPITTGGGYNIEEEQTSMYNHQVVLPSQARPFPTTATSAYPMTTALAQPYGREPETSTRYTSQDNQLLLQNNQMLRSGSDTLNQNSYSGNALALGPPHPALPRSYSYQSAQLPYQVFSSASVDWSRRLQDPATPAIPFDHLFSEEDIRAKSAELLGTDDLQQILKSQYLGLPEAAHLQGEDVYPFTGYTPASSIVFTEGGVRTSGRAYVGWLKLKAALRWGIFIRKIAAEKASKRAQLEELED